MADDLKGAIRDAAHEIAEALTQQAAAVDRQTAYLKERDDRAREDWRWTEDTIAARRQEDIERRERERQEDYERGLMVRGLDQSLARALTGPKR